MMKPLDVVILCGGLGERLRSTIGNGQKTMAKVADRPFLDLQFEFLTNQGFKRIILSIGYQAGEVRDYFSQKKLDVTIVYSEEKEPLGTGGAVGHTRDYIQSDSFIVLNGDSFCPIDYAAFLCFHEEKQALATMVLSPMNEAEDYGTVIIDDSQHVIQFQEKLKTATPAKGLVNAGIYCFRKDIFSYMPQQERFSLETDFFPQLIGKEIFGFPVTTVFVDIGTPERYQEAQQLLRKAE